MVEGFVINETELRHLYRILNHGEAFSRVHCQDPNVKGPKGSLCSTLVKGEEAVVEWAKTWDTKGQCYISRNPMLAWNKPGKFTCLTFDIDPNYDKAQGANHHELESAIRAGRRVLERYAGGYFATSGNGVLLLYTLPAYITERLNGTCASAYKALSEEIAQTITDGCKLDILADDMRLVRMIGTKNVRGKAENHRVAKFIQLPKPGQTTAVALLTRLLELANAPKPKVPESSIAYEPWVISALDDLGEPGARYPTIIRLAGYFGGKRIPMVLASRLINEANSKTANSPYSDEEVGQFIRSVYKKIQTGEYDADESVAVATQEAPCEVGTIGHDTEAYLKDLEARSQFKTPELPWPFEELNHMTWGLPRGALTVLGAWTGKGKTSIAITVSEFLNRIGKSVLYFPTEMSRKEIKDRYISAATGIINLHLFNGQLSSEEHASLKGFLSEFQQRQFFLPVTDAPRLNPFELRRALDKAQPDFLVVDFLQRLGSRASDRRREVAEFIMTVKDEVAKRKIGCLVLSQFHRPQKAQNGKYFPPSIFDFAECGDIENTSDISIIMHPPLDEKGFIVELQDGERYKPVLCNVAKNRHGGTTGVTYLKVDTLTTRFSDA